MPDFPLEKVARLGVPHWNSFGSDADVGAIIYSPTLKDTKFLVRALRKVLKSNHHSTDMTALNFVRKKYPDLFKLFPSSYQDETYKSIPYVFDGASLGMWLFGEDPSVLTPIVFTNHDSNSSIGIEILPLASEIERFHKDKRRKLIVKMDIEGAEWRILRSQSSVQSLCDNSAILLLAVHPGFYQPFVKRFRGFNRITLLVWDFRNYWESLLVFKHLSGVAIIRRTNLNLVHHKHQFAALIMAGYHEFIIEFQPS